MPFKKIKKNSTSKQNGHENKVQSFVGEKLKIISKIFLCCNDNINEFISQN